MDTYPSNNLCLCFCNGSTGIYSCKYCIAQRFDDQIPNLSQFFHRLQIVKRSMVTKLCRSFFHSCVNTSLRLLCYFKLKDVKLQDSPSPLSKAHCRYSLAHSQALLPSFFFTLHVEKSWAEEPENEARLSYLYCITAANSSKGSIFSRFLCRWGKLARKIACSIAGSLTNEHGPILYPRAPPPPSI